MTKFTVTCISREEIEIEADSEEEAIAAAQNTDSDEFSFVEARWSAEPTDGTD